MENPSQSEYYSQMPLPDGSITLEMDPTPNDPPWGIGAAIGVWIASVFFILVIPTIFLLPYIVSKASEMSSDEMIEFAKSDPISIFLQIIGIIPAHILTLLLAWLVVSRGRKFSFKQTLGWRRGGFHWWHYCIILAAFFVVAQVVSNYFPEQENDLIRMLHSSRFAVYLVALVATFTAPIVEEVVYRGILYSAFQKTLGVPVAFVVATLLFSIVHVPQYYPSYSTIFLLCLLSVVLTSIRVWSGNLLPCIILHTLFNGLQSILLILEPYMRSADSPGQASIWFHILR